MGLYPTCVHPGVWWEVASRACGVSTGACLRRLSWGPPGPAPVVSSTWHQVACHLPVLATLLATLARSGGPCGSGAQRDLFQGLNVSCRSGQACSQAFGADLGA